VLQQAQQRGARTASAAWCRPRSLWPRSFPDVGDKLNGDEMLDELAESWGVSPRVLHGADEVATRSGRPSSRRRRQRSSSSR
jgi:hypothetical protein